MNSLAWVPLAMADEPKVSQPTYTLSFDIPDHGVIDLYHNAYMGRDRISNSLYLLRNTAVEDLLNTRRSLKTLLGGTERLRKVSGNSTLGFEVPGGIIDLYLLGQLGADTLSGSDQNSSGPSSGTPQSSTHGIDVETVPEIANAIHWIGGHEPQYNETLRARLLLGLAYISAQLTKFDMQLKFIQDDYWVDPGVSAQYYKEEVEPSVKAAAMMGAANGGMVGISGETYKMIKDFWLEKHKMKDVINVLAGHREYLLDRYHLLGIEVGGTPLYKLIYKAMEKSGFPSAEMVQPAVEHHLPPNSEPIPMPTTFEEAVDKAFGIQTTSAGNAQFAVALMKSANDPVDQALVLSLQANTERLTELSKEIDYTGDRSSPLLALAKYDDLWDAAIAKHGYLIGIVDMAGAREEIKGYWDRRETTNRRLRYTAIGVGIGIGIAAIVFSGGAVGEAGAVAVEGGEAIGAAASLLGIPLRTWLIGAGMLTDVGLSYDVYVNSAEAAKIAKGLYLGTTNVGSNADMKNTEEMKEADFHLLLGSLICLGMGTTQLARLAVVRTVVTRAGQAFVQLTSEELAMLRGAVTQLASRAEALAPLGRALLATVRNILGMTVGEERVMALGDAITSVAKELKMAPAALAARLEAAPGIGRLIKGWRMRDLSSRILIERGILKSTFGSDMVKQQLNNAVVSVVAEGMARGKKMLNEERNEFIGDMVRGTLITAVLTYNGAPVAAEAEQQILGTSSRLRVQGGFWNTEAGQLLKAGGSNAMVGMIINGVTDGTSEAIQYIGDRDKPNAPTASDRLWRLAKGTAWNGISLGISSTGRYRFFKWLDTYVTKKLSANATSKILVTSAWTGNNLFGSWSYVYFGQKWNFLDSSGKPVANDAPESSLDENIAGIEIEKLGGAFFRVSADDVAAGYMFDFLRAGDQAGPAPVIQ